MKGGTVPVMFLSTKDSPVTEPSVLQMIPRHEQCVAEFDEVQWLRGGGFCQCCFSFSRTACS
jgi:hypothetical protein